MTYLVIDMDVIEKLNTYREAREMSQVELAKRLGVSFPTVNRWFNKRVKPNRVQLRKIENFLEENPIPAEPTVSEHNGVFRFENPRQERIYKALSLVGPGPAANYRDVCQLLSRKEADFLASRTHLIAHLLREIESALMDVLTPLSRARAGNQAHQEKGQDGHKKARVRAILKALAVPEDHPMAQSWLKIGLHKLAHRRALWFPRPFDSEFQDSWDTVENVLDFVLQEFQKYYLRYFTQLDTLVVKSRPTKEDLQFLSEEVPRNQVMLNYFFSRLTSPEWLDGLRAHDFFRYPPEPDFDEETKTVRFQIWPASRYLAKVAALAPAKVVAVIRQIPRTKNPRVYEDLVEAAAKMPSEVAVLLVDDAIKWFDSSEYLFQLPEKLGGLMAHLAKGGKVDAALQLAKALFSVRAGSSGSEKKSRAALSLPPDPLARFSAWEYHEMMERDFTELVKTGGFEAFDLVCDLLEEAVELSRRRRSDKGPEDYSYIWYPTLEDGPRVHGDGVREALVSAVRDAAERLCQTDSQNVLKIVRRFQKRFWRVFHRIGLHVLRRYPVGVEELVAEQLTDQKLFDTAWASREYRLLLREHFSKLGSDRRKIILSWIETGPPTEYFRGEQNKQQILRTRKMWQRDKLSWIGSGLPREWRQAFDGLVSELGTPPDLTEGLETFSWTGPTSPKSADELKSMSIEEIVSFLKGWQPDSKGWVPSPEGMQRVLSATIAEDPSRFAESAVKFQDLDPTYVRALMEGLEKSAKEKRLFDWVPVVNLCLWVVAQPRQIKGREVAKYDRDTDPDWGWTRKTIARLFHTGFEEGLSCLPFNLREQVWAVLQRLAEDPDPPQFPERTDKYEDFLTESINTVRGEVLHTVVRYAFWVRRHFEKSAEGSERLARGFEEIPEVREMLERHLDVSQDASLAIRSVYGQWFPWLFLLDKEWALHNVDVIFPMDEKGSVLRIASWGTYLRFCQPYNDVADILRHQYGFAVDGLRPSSKLDSGRAGDVKRHIEQGLAEHLMAFGWRGKLSEELLSRFWAKADPSLREFAIDYTGRSLYHTEGPLSQETQERLKALWEARLQAVREIVASGATTKELSGFGWWFAAGKFPDSWAISQLIEALELCGKADGENFILTRLLKIAPQLPLQALQLLEALIDSDKTDWGVYTWRDEAKPIVAAALDSNDPGTTKAARDFINRMSARGYLGFREMLPLADGE